MPSKAAKPWGRNWEKEVATALGLIHLPENKKIAVDHLKALHSRRGGKARPPTRRNHARVLAKLDNHLGKPYGEVTKADLVGFFDTLEDDIGEGTVNLCKRITKTFYKHRYPEAYDRVAAWIKVANGRPDLMAADMLTEQEVRRMLDAAEAERTRAAIAVLYDSGLRYTSEFMRLRIGDMRPIPDYPGAMNIVLPAETEGLKTGRRTVPIVRSVPYLQAFLAHHPDRDNPDAPLWPPIAAEYRGRPVDSEALAHAIKYAARRAGISKRIWMHLLRHSRATEMARNGFNESQLRKHFGWSRSSQMPAFHVHLAAQDLQNKVIEEAGIKPKPMAEESPLAPVVCAGSVCGYSNPPGAIFCARCGRPLTTGGLVEHERKGRIVEEQVAALKESLLALQAEMRKLKEAELVVAGDPMGDLDRRLFAAITRVARKRPESLDELKKFFKILASSSLASSAG
jgi:site-specific recombinase XerD